MERLNTNQEYKNKDYIGENLRGRNYTEAKFDTVIFQKAKLQKAKFIRSTFIKDIDFKKANLNGADFSNAEILEADFTGSDLRGANFNGAKLGKVNFNKALLQGADFTDAKVLLEHNVDFSNAYIKGANFTNSKFSGVKFYRVKAGVKNIHLFFVVPFLIAFSALSAFTTAIILSLSRYYFYKRKSTSSEKYVWLASVFLITLLRYYMTGLSLDIFTITLFNQNSNFLITLPMLHLFVAIALILVAGYSVSLITWINELKYDIKFLGFLIIVLISYIGITLDSQRIEEFINNLLFGLLPDKLGAGVVGASIGAWLGCYFSRRVLAKDESFYWLWNIYVLFISNGGSVFDGADLTDANFQEASLRGANFKNAIITRTRWYKANDLEFARFGNNYLKFPEVRKLLVDQVFTKQKNQENVFEGGDFQGLNLESAQLSGINFTGTNLSHANFKNADLRGAILKGAKLEGSDLTDAKLTKACIDSLNYNDSTILKGVECEYVYIKYIDSIQGYERFPRNITFKTGDFEKLFSKEKNVIQLFVRSEDNREALASAFKSLMDGHNIVKGFEILGDDDALVKIKIPDDKDKDMVEIAFYQLYRAKDEETTTTQSNSNSQQVGDEGIIQFLYKELVLSPQQKKKLQEALIHAFPTIEYLEQMLSYGLNINLGTVAAEGSLQNIVFTLIRHADAQGWLGDLIRTACNENPGNIKLRDIAKELLSDNQ